MGVDFGGAEFFVSEHELDGSEVGSSFEEVCGEGVSEGVWVDVFLYSGSLGEVSDDAEDHDAADVFDVSSGGDEDVVGVVGGNVPEVAVEEVESEFSYCAWGDGYDALFVAFAHDAHVAVVEEEGGEPQVAEFADAEPAAVEHFDDGAVALSFGSAEVLCCYDAVDFVDGEDFGQSGGLPGGGEQVGGVVFDEPVEEEVAIEGAYAREDAVVG